MFVTPDWKSLPGTYTLAYYEYSNVTNKKSYTTLGPGLQLVLIGADIPTENTVSYGGEELHICGASYTRSFVYAELRIRGASYTRSFVYEELRIQYTNSYTETWVRLVHWWVYTSCHRGGSYAVIKSYNYCIVDELS